MHNIELLTDFPTAPYQLAIPYSDSSQDLSGFGIKKSDLDTYKAEP